MNSEKLIETLYNSLGQACVTDPDVAHIEIHANKVLGLHLVDGLEVKAEELADGIRAEITVKANHKIDKPVRICFGLLDKAGTQKVYMNIRMEENARVAILSSCTFPNAENVVHAMDANIDIGKGAEYIYLERHVHSDQGGVRVIPKAKIHLQENAKFRSDFELIEGRVGVIDIDYDAECGANTVLDMAARINARGDDRVSIHEKANLNGKGAHGVLRTNIAVRDDARAEIKNTLVASAPYARGHVDCKEVVRNNAVANAVPIVEVQHSRAHVTHEASIGSVDSKQLETLMSRGLSEDDATDLIIEGLLSPDGKPF